MHKATAKLQMADTTEWVKKADGQFYSENWAERKEVRDETGFCSHLSTLQQFGMELAIMVSRLQTIYRVITGDTTLTGHSLPYPAKGTKKPISINRSSPTDTTITDHGPSSHS